MTGYNDPPSTVPLPAFDGIIDSSIAQAARKGAADALERALENPSLSPMQRRAIEEAARENRERAKAFDEDMRDLGRIQAQDQRERDWSQVGPELEKVLNGKDKQSVRDAFDRAWNDQLSKENDPTSRSPRDLNRVFEKGIEYGRDYAGDGQNTPSERSGGPGNPGNDPSPGSFSPGGSGGGDPEFGPGGPSPSSDPVDTPGGWSPGGGFSPGGSGGGDPNYGPGEAPGGTTPAGWDGGGGSRVNDTPNPGVTGEKEVAQAGGEENSSNERAAEPDGSTVPGGQPDYGGIIGDTSTDGIVPIILDLTGQGIKITAANRSNIFFDTAGDG